MGTRAGIVVTGTEVLTGRVADRNGPWLAEQLRLLGVDVAQIVVVGDRPEDLRQSLEFFRSTGVDLIITSGGLGPTADDLTAEIVGAFQGRALRLDEALEADIARIVERLIAGRGLRMSASATAEGTRKQALVPEAGAAVIAPVGTAPGLIVPAGAGGSGPPVVVLPGPPRELQGMWDAVVSDPVVGQAIAGRVELRQRTMRLWGTPESELAATLRDAEAELGGLEITTCLRDGELEIVTRFAPSAQPAYDRLVELIDNTYSKSAFSISGATIDEIVAQTLRARQLTIATAESCTAGLLAGRLTDLAGSSDYVLGGLVVYSNQAKHALAGVPEELIQRLGTVSAEVAEALARGAAIRLGADIGIGITGVAGPGGGSAEKPVGLVYLCAHGVGRTIARRVVLPGARSDVRTRAVALAMHLLRELIEPELR